MVLGSNDVFGCGEISVGEEERKRSLRLLPAPPAFSMYAYEIVYMLTSLNYYLQPGSLQNSRCPWRSHQMSLRGLQDRKNRPKWTQIRGDRDGSKGEVHQTGPGKTMVV